MHSLSSAIKWCRLHDDVSGAVDALQSQRAPPTLSVDAVCTASQAQQRHEAPLQAHMPTYHYVPVRIVVDMNVHDITHGHLL